MIEFVLNAFKAYLNFLISNYFSITKFSIITQIIALAVIILYFYMIVESIRLKPIEGVTKGKVWITYAIIHGVFGITAGILAFFVMGAIYIAIYFILGGLFNLNWPFEEIGCIVILASSLLISCSIFMTRNEEYLSNKKNIGREEATTTKKYILLLLKMVGMVLLVILALPLALIGVLGYFLLRYLGITADHIRDYAQDKSDDETLYMYEQQKIRGVQTNERTVYDDEAEMAKERQELREKRKYGNDSEII